MTGYFILDHTGTFRCTSTAFQTTTDISDVLITIYFHSECLQLLALLLKYTGTLLYLYRARNKITQLSISTHAQLQCHRLKFIKNHLKKLLHVSVYDHLQGVYNVLAKITIILTTFGCMLSVVMWQHVVSFVSGCT